MILNVACSLPVFKGVNVKFENLTMGYAENIIQRVNIYGEKIVVIVNNESTAPNYDMGRKIFEITNSVSVNMLIEKSTIAIYDNTIVKDINNEFNR